jgi:hypothetical protein
MEANNYPIFGIMYHPEYQFLRFSGRKKWELVADDVTDEIGFRLSLKMNRIARKNSNRPNTEYDSLFRTYGVSRAPSQVYPMVPGLNVRAYGYQR